jgi:hypothetical protein
MRHQTLISLTSFCNCTTVLKPQQESVMRFNLVRSAKSSRRSSLVDLVDTETGTVILSAIRVRNNEASAAMQGANAAFRHLTAAPKTDAPASEVPVA